MVTEIKYQSLSCEVLRFRKKFCVLRANCVTVQLSEKRPNLSQVISSKIRGIEDQI